MDELPTLMLPAVPHVTFLIFNLAIPNIIAWATVFIVFGIAAWLRMPKIF